MWGAFAAVGCLTSATLVLLLKGIGNRLGGVTWQQGMAIAALVLVGAGVLGACVLAVVPCAPVAAQVPGLLVGASLALIATQMALVVAINGAPNPGFAHIAINFNALLVAVASVGLFGSRLGLRAGIGIVVAMGGLALVLC